MSAFYELIETIKICMAKEGVSITLHLVIKIGHRVAIVMDLVNESVPATIIENRFHNTILHVILSKNTNPLKPQPSISDW